MKPEPGRLHGLPVLWLRSEACTAAVSLQGGQLLYFVPRGGRDYLWLSTTPRPAPAAIRGGVPVCWPYFGREGQAGDVPQHGFARNRAWVLESSQVDAAGCISAALVLPAEPSCPLRLVQTLQLGATGFVQALHVRNEGDAPQAFSQALHSYFAVADAARASLRGVDGLEYADNHDGQWHRQHGHWDLHDPRDPGRSDRKYRDAGGDYLLLDPAGGRALRIRSRGSRSLVVWNPGAAGEAALGDVPAGAWREFVCVEVGNVGADGITLAPGASHCLSQQVTQQAPG